MTTQIYVNSPKEAEMYYFPSLSIGDWFLHVNQSVPCVKIDDSTAFNPRTGKQLSAANFIDAKLTLLQKVTITFSA